MYLIPSFVLIPIIFIVLFILNRRHEKQLNETIKGLIQSPEKDALFDAPTLNPPKVIKNASTMHPKVMPSNTKKRKLTDEEKRLHIKRIAELRAQLEKVQQNKSKLKNIQKKDRMVINTASSKIKPNNLV